MAYKGTIRHCLISSPRDVPQADLAIVHKTINHWNGIYGGRYGSVIIPISWGSHAAAEFGRGAQAILNDQLVDSCDMCLAIFWARLGTRTAKNESGSAEEIERLSARGKYVAILRCIRDVPQNTDIGQLDRLNKYLKKLESKSFIMDYENDAELGTRVENILVRGVDLDQTEPAPLTGPQGLLQIAAVATKYYQEGRSKVDIAQDLGMTWYQVARLLTAARERRIVRIDIALPDAINAELSSELATAFGLRQAIVVDSPDEPVSTLRAELGRVAAGLLAELVQEDDVVGIAWGRTVNAITAALTGLKRCSIVQMTGAFGAEASDNAIALVGRMSQISGGRDYPMYAPFLLDDPATAKSVRSEAHVAQAVSWYDRIKIAIVPIGSWVPPQSQLYDSITPQERRELLDAGVRADISTVLLSRSGEILTPPLSQRLIGITGKQLRNIPEVVAVAGGVDKADAVGVALRAGFVTTLITNASVAQELLKQERGNALTSR
jgi:DNA-binding transcriptional regulator LsrR (DeoR family)